MRLSRRGVGVVVLGLLGGAGVASLKRSAKVTPLPLPAGGPELVPTGRSRADAAWLKPRSLVRAQRFSPNGPAVDLLYEVVGQEPLDDQTRLALPDGGWARQLHPSGVLNALAFGAIGDGVADDTAALQDFLDAVVRGGTRGYLPAGTYRVTEPMRIGDNRAGTSYRGFTIEGAGRTGLGGSLAPGGTLILLDSAKPAEAVVLWAGDAWRDGRMTALGLASSKPDGARYGLLVTSSEVSNLEFDRLHVENVTTAFGLLAGTGGNGEFCAWSHIQTWNVRNFFYSDAGQAYGLRFRDCFCYYRPGGVLFRFDARINGGGLHLSNVDASPVRPNAGQAPNVEAGTTLLLLTDKHNAPVTVIGGRFEHITTIADVQSNSVDIIIHNQIQFIGCDFTTDLDRAAVAGGKATVRMRDSVLADINFLNCSFASALTGRDDELVLVRADDGCRGTIRFGQCGHWGYAEPPIYRGPAGTALRLEWSDCQVNDVQPGMGFAGRAMGRRYDRTINPPAGTMRLSAKTGRWLSHDGERWRDVPRIIAADAPPERGIFQAGDFCCNASPATGQPIGWICLDGGAPGRWVAAALL